MSFDSYNNKPRLVEKKLIKFHTNKIKNIEIDKQIKEDIVIKEKIELEEIKANKWYNKCLTIILNFIKENYGFVLIVTLLLILLYVRYLEVEKRKAKIKEIRYKNLQNNQDIY